jgi:hypothetical protein
MAKVTKTSITLSVMNAHGDKPMAAVVALIVKAQHKAGFLDVTDKIAAGAYRWAVNKGMAPGSAPVRGAKPEKASAKEKAVKRMAKETVAKAAQPKVVKPEAPTKSAEEIDRIKAANMARMKAVLAKTKQTVRKDEDAPVFAETDAFAAPAFLTKDEVTALV